MSDSQLESVPPWEDAPETTAPDYPEFDDVSDAASSTFDDEAAEQAVFDGGEKRAWLMRKGPLLLRLLTDRMSAEFFLPDE